MNASRPTVIADDRRRAAPLSDSPLRVLVLDDDDNYLQYIAAVTRRVGFAVETASDVEKGLETLARAECDVAVIDYEMPRMNGVELIRRIREDDSTRAIYAVMLTAHEDIDTKLTALHSGFDDFIAKSSPEAELVARLSAARRVAARQRTMDLTIRELYGMATHDELTGLFNRRFFVAEVERLLSGGETVSVILFDVDDFKQVNDRHGHVTGDCVLRDIGALLHRGTRPADIVARLGGDEFVMAIPDLPTPDIERIARRVARDVRALRWPIDGGAMSLSVSTGVATSRLLSHPTLMQLLSAADGDMYKNKWLRRRGQTSSSAPAARLESRPERPA